ncbi:MAG: hypothetical protein AAF560_12385 [Acidobacteriota bacterium]
MDEVRRLVRKAEKNAYRMLEEPKFWMPEFCSAFFEWCGAQASEPPDTVLIRGQVAIELTTRTGNSHSLSKAHGAMALADRRMLLLDLAEKELETAFRLAQSYPCCLAQTFRCQGIVRLHQKRFTDAIDCFNRASTHHRTLGNTDGIGRCLIARGLAHWPRRSPDAVSRAAGSIPRTPSIRR